MNGVSVPGEPPSAGGSGLSAREARYCALARIEAARRAGESASGLVAEAAAALGVADRTVWRWLARGLPGGGPPRGWRPSEGDVAAYVRWKGNAAAAWRERNDEGAGLPSLRTFQAALASGLTPGDRATIQEGVEGRRRHQVYLRWEPSARNELWEADHKQLDVPVLFPRRQRPIQPWTTLFLDGYSRAVMGWAISDYPSSATVLAALGEAIRLDETRGPFAGLPTTLRPDRGLEFASEALEQACGVLGVHLSPTPAYTPHLKGKVERLHASLVTMLLAELPQFTGGPRDAAGELWGSGEVLTLGQLVERFDAWVLAYNTERPHAALGGVTPLGRWREDASPLRTVAEPELRWTLLAGKPRVVRTSGISFQGLNFVAPEMNGLVGESVEVRYRPHDLRSVEVFRSGAHLCTAWPQGALTPEQREAVLTRRRADAAEQARRQRRASRSARTRVAPVTSPGETEDTTVIAQHQVAPDHGRWDDSSLRRAARVDLLNLPSRGPH